MKPIQRVKNDLQAWLKEAEKAPNFKTLLQNKYFELRDELEAEGLRFRETEDTLIHLESRSGAHWGEVRSEFRGRGRAFLGMQVGQDWMARFNALCIAYLQAKEWLLALRQDPPGVSGPA
ncbi:MAG TPA: hypothetical protein VJ385_20070 [Fibrobacteria bacterium]|nr:hypothetical protein [Fibrobacteria bacterium]